MDVIENFLQYARHELNRSALTVRAYGTDLRQFADFVAPDASVEALAQVTTADVREWVAQLSGEGNSARTLRRKVQAVRAMYRYMVKHGMVSCDPSRDIEPAKLPKRLPSWVRPEVMDGILDAEVDADDYNAMLAHTIVLMLYSTGMRRAELIGLQDAAVDNDKRELRVLGKRDKERVIPYGNELATWIDRYRTLRDSTVGHGGGTFFITRRGEALYPTLVYNIVHNTLAPCGSTEQMSPHTLRHSFASAMLSDGAGLESVKELLGHSSLAATQIYTHVTLSELQHNYKLAHPRAQRKE